MKSLAVLLVALMTPLVVCAQETQPANNGGADKTQQRVSFERQVSPLLERRCNRCHNSDEKQSGLDLTRLDTILRGGESLGAAVKPHDPQASPLLLVLTGEQEPKMPPEGEPLEKAEVELLRDWIQRGAIDDTPEFTTDDVTFFEREIRPVLFERCFKCHAGESPEGGLRLTSRHGVLTGGSRGPAAIPGEPEQSLLLRAIRHDGELKMPRGGDQLSAAQVSAFENWIRRGLPWPSHERVLARTRVFTISDADREHWAFRPLPKAAPDDWSIDGVLRAHHTRLGLTPAEPADRHRLLRRLTYDLIGYPPTPEEIATFISDDSPDAYAKVVDRLLAAPQFGWRWGRHWLDYTRNGANGQSNRGPDMDDARYAAWVAHCVNDDRPYDWFARVHLAGDHMPGFDGEEYSIDQAVAAAVPLNGPRTFQNAATDTFVLMDKLDESVEFMGRSLLGISLECARCHNHKFDPVSQRDYYALLGFFQSSWFGPIPASTKTRKLADNAVSTIRELRQEQSRLNGLIRRAGTKINVGGGGLVRKWQESRTEALAKQDRQLAELEVTFLEAELRQAEQAKEEQLADDLRRTIADRREALRNFQPRDFRTSTMKEIGYDIHGHKSNPGYILRATNVGLTEVVAALEAQDQFWEEERDRWGEHQRFGGYTKSAPEVAELAAWDDQVQALGQQLAALETNQVLVRCEGGLRRAEDLGPFKSAAEDQGIAFYPEQLPPYYGDARLLRRGDVLEPDALIPRGFPEFFGGGQPNVADSGRLELAAWLTKPDSLQASLVARSAVNRVWQHLFGEALCRTPKELGRLGEQPELPELIDGLAVRFMRERWSMKALVREIVTSQAYRRSTITSDELYERDPANRWFARQSVERLESEPIANTMAYLRQGERYVEPSEVQKNLLGYAEFVRYFDPPTTDDLIDRRVASISAAQALFLMNNNAAARGLAGAIANRVCDDDDDSLSDVLPELYLLVVQRPPTSEDRRFAESFVARRREQTGAADHAAEICEFISLLLCSNELIYVE